MRNYQLATLTVTTITCCMVLVLILFGMDVRCCDGTIEQSSFLVCLRYDHVRYFAGKSIDCQEVQEKREVVPPPTTSPLPVPTFTPKPTRFTPQPTTPRPTRIPTPVPTAKATPPVVYPTPRPTYAQGVCCGRVNASYTTCIDSVTSVQCENLGTNGVFNYTVWDDSYAGKCYFQSCNSSVVFGTSCCQYGDLQTAPACSASMTSTTCSVFAGTIISPAGCDTESGLCVRITPQPTIAPPPAWFGACCIPSGIGGYNGPGATPWCILVDDNISCAEENGNYFLGSYTSCTSCPSPTPAPTVFDSWECCTGLGCYHLTYQACSYINGTFKYGSTCTIASPTSSFGGLCSPPTAPVPFPTMSPTVVPVPPKYACCHETLEYTYLPYCNTTEEVNCPSPKRWIQGDFCERSGACDLPEPTPAPTPALELSCCTSLSETTFDCVNLTSFPTNATCGTPSYVRIGFCNTINNCAPPTPAPPSPAPTPAPPTPSPTPLPTSPTPKPTPNPTSIPTTSPTPIPTVAGESACCYYSSAFCTMETLAACASYGGSRYSKPGESCGGGGGDLCPGGGFGN